MRYHSTKKWCLVGAVVGLLGCRTSLQEAEPSIQFCVLNPAASKGSGLSAGDEVAVCARLDGAEHYFLQHATFTIGADGRSLTASPGVLYPQAKQAVAFYAYFPYHTGLFSVPSDQSTAAALKQADLCWATASSTPVPTLVPLEFEHTMARLVVVANKTPTKITVPNALVGGSLDIKTGVFTPTGRSEVSTTGSELIVPGQSVSRLIVTVGGVEYVFDGSISLSCGQTTTINLTLHPNTHIATLSGSSSTDWTTGIGSGNSTRTATNQLTLACAPVHPRMAEVSQIVLTIKDMTSGLVADYTVSANLTVNNSTFVFPFVAVSLSYPYLIQKIQLYNSIELIQSIDRIVGGTVYKPGVYTVGCNTRLINPPREDQIFIFDDYGAPLCWTKGYLVAKAGTLNECMVGTETDMGLYFQFGSLIGWSGAKTADGTGYVSAASQALPSNRRVHPIECTNPPSVLSTTAYNDLDHFYFGLQSAPYNGYADIHQYPRLTAHQYASKGIGDPCSYYLGEPWRLPTDVEQWALWRRLRGSSTNFPWVSGYEWDGNSYLGYNGVRFYNTARTDYAKFCSAGLRQPYWSSGTGYGNYAIVMGGFTGNTSNATQASYFTSACPYWVSQVGAHENGCKNIERTMAVPIRCVQSL